MWKFIHKLSSPPYFFDFAKKIIPWLLIIGILQLIIGAINGLFFAPADYQQGDAFRIIYVHVPAAYLSIMIYTIMAVASFVGLIWRIKLAHTVSISAAPVGAWLTFLALLTGSIWGRPMWGTWWEWGDPRLTSELIMFFLYIGFIALHSSIDDLKKADRAGAILILVGAINVPIIHFSVEWWSSLHQGPTLFRADGPSIDPSMLYPLVLMILGFCFYFCALILIRIRGEILYRQQNTNWVRNLIERENYE